MSARTSSVLIRTTHSIAHGASSHVDVITPRVSAERHRALSPKSTACAGRYHGPVSWLYIGLLACAVAVLIGAEWPRLAERFGLEARERRERTRRKAQLRVIRSDEEEFEASVQRDLERLPTIEEQEPRR